jgi:phosphatidylglycerol:prolipoprotein diacylglycerol transferase
VIPYYQFPSYHLGPFTLEIFGVFVVIGVFLGARLAYTQAKARGLDPEPLADLALWAVGAGVVMGHFVHLFLYHPEEISFAQTFKVWDGLSSFGGLLGAVIACAIFFRLRGLSFGKYGDALALGTAPGWAVARLGCFAVHDHPGILTSSPLAVNFPMAYYGGPRFDLGLFDAVALGLMTLVLYLVRKKPALNGKLLPLLALMYGPSRFFLDFLRAADLSYVDKRYLDLTPAQYACVILVGYAIYGLTRGRRAAEPTKAVPMG